MAATRPVTITLLCPSCRQNRTCRAVGTATVAKRRRELVQCLEPSCELVWLPSRGHLTTPAAAA